MAEKASYDELLKIRQDLEKRVAELEDAVDQYSGMPDVLHDTGLFGDMRLIGDFFSPDLVFLPIGDRYTMGIRSAAKAVELIRPRRVVPIHYNTWPLIPADPEEFKRLVEEKTEVVILEPGGEMEI
jgi:L-ascorbate metabolism protein UlaG (beta-lactamase superfamily)